MARQRSLSDGLPSGQRRGPQAKAKLVAAYLECFKEGREATEVVLADLAHQAGLYRVTKVEGDPAYALAFAEGRRSLLLGILSFLRMTPEQIRNLETAAHYEASVSAEEGSI